MFDVKPWMEELTGRLKDAFGPRLLFVGLQGSYGRGEAGPESDVDVVAVLDKLSAADLDLYRDAVAAMPRREKACGFVCGAEDLKRWPRHELVQFEQDILPVWGTLEGLLPPCGREDLAKSAEIGAASLYHALCHSYLYGRGLARLDHRCKEAFFVLRALHQLRCGEYVHTRRALASRLEGEERAILEYGTETEAEGKAMLDTLLRWTQSVLEEVQSMRENIT